MAKRTASTGTPAAPRKRTARGPGGHRDWTSLLTPILATVIISVAAQVGTGIWQGATFRAQVVNMDQHQKKQDDAIQANSDALRALMTRLPIDYMPRVEIEANRERTKEMRDVENQRLDNLDRKIDLILSNQQSSRR